MKQLKVSERRKKKKKEEKNVKNNWEKNEKRKR